jgi:hypothetical protein
MPHFAAFTSCNAGLFNHLTSQRRRKNMGKGNNSQKNDKKDKKAKQGSKKSAGKSSNKK